MFTGPASWNNSRSSLARRKRWSARAKCSRRRNTLLSSPVRLIARPRQLPSPQPTTQVSLVKTTGGGVILSWIHISADNRMAFPLPADRTSTLLRRGIQGCPWPPCTGEKPRGRLVRTHTHACKRTPYNKPIKYTEDNKE